jgi:endogenous inhibitor of DNA gyrase (YacG/DUF329 family)
MNNTITNTNLWEEKNSTEVNPNLSSKNESVTADTISSTENELKKKECENTGKKWTKKCPDCGKLQIYSNKQNLTVAINENRICKSCFHNSVKIIRPIGGWLRVCPECGKNIEYQVKNSFVVASRSNSWCRSCIAKSRMFKDGFGFKSGESNPSVINPKYGESNPFFGKRHTEEFKTMMSEIGKKNSTGRVTSIETKLKISAINKGKKRSPETIEKIRLNSKIQFLEWKRINGLLKIGCNPTACAYFDTLNNKIGTNIQHALNGGEIMCLAYFLDGYDAINNIVFEYDEKHHYDVYGNLNEKDVIRITYLHIIY